MFILIIGSGHMNACMQHIYRDHGNIDDDGDMALYAGVRGDAHLHTFDRWSDYL